MEANLKFDKMMVPNLEQLSINTTCTDKFRGRFKHMNKNKAVKVFMEDKVLNRKEQRERVVRYVLFMYDEKSPLHNACENINEKRKEACKLAHISANDLYKDTGEKPSRTNNTPMANMIHFNEHKSYQNLVLAVWLAQNKNELSTYFGMIELYYDLLGYVREPITETDEYKVAQIKEKKSKMFMETVQQISKEITSAKENLFKDDDGLEELVIVQEIEQAAVGGILEELTMG